MRNGGGPGDCWKSTVSPRILLLLRLERAVRAAHPQRQNHSARAIAFSYRGHGGASAMRLYECAITRPTSSNAVTSRNRRGQLLHPLSFPLLLSPPLTSPPPLSFAGPSMVC